MVTPGNPHPHPAPTPDRTRRRMGVAIGVMLGCAVLIVGTVLIVTGGSPDEEADKTPDDEASTSTEEVSYRIPAEFCSDELVALFEDIPGYDPGISKTFDQVEIEFDEEGLVDDVRCTAKVAEVGVDAYLFESSADASRFYKDNVGTTMYDFETEKVNGSQWTQGQSGFGIELSLPTGVVFAQAGRLVIGTSASLDVDEDIPDEDLPEQFGDPLLKVAETVEQMCRK